MTLTKGVYAAVSAIILFAATSHGQPEGNRVMARPAPPVVARTDGARTARVGEPAPRFALDAVIDKKVRKISLKDYLGSWVVLFFYPYDFSIICPTEIRGFNEKLSSFRELDAEVLGVSTDSTYSHLAWIERGDLGDLKFPLLSDMNRKASSAYGVLDPITGTAFRALFIIDPQGTLQYMVVHNMAVGRNVEETLRVLEALQTGALCPVDWKKGDKPLQK